MTVISRDRAKQKMTPEGVYAYANLLLTDDNKRNLVPAIHHKLWIEYAIDENVKRLLIIAPPGTAKTTWLVSAFLGYYLGIFPDRHTIIGSVDDATAEKRSLSLRSMVESEKWRAVFPGIEPDHNRKWEQKEWSIGTRAGDLHPTMRSYGTGASITGSRAELLLGDDLLDYNNTRTPGMREVVRNWFDNSFLSRLTPDGRAIIIGTSWNAADIYADLRKLLSWTIIHMPLLSEAEDGYCAFITKASRP